MQLRELTDRYQLQKILKSTRFGTVLRATDVPSGRTVAVKLVTVGSSPGLDAGAAEFEQLAAKLAGLAHPNFPAVLDFGFTTEGSAFLALELLEGKGFDTLAGVPPARLLALVGEALNGLEALAGQGLAHHNLCPDNLFIVSGPGGERAVLLGLGTAVFRPRGPAAATVENARFLAPELTAGGAADWRADLYSLALIACQALGATIGFGESPVVQLPLAVSFELESDEALRQALERSLRQRPGERPSLAELREALRLAIGAPLPFQPPQPSRQMAPPASPLQPSTPASLPQPAPPAASPLVMPETWASAAAPVAPPVKPAPFPAPPAPPAPPAAPLAPEFLTPDPLPPLASGETVPEEPGDVLSAVDDEILNALLSVPAPPPRPAKATEGPGEPAKVVPFLKKKAPAAAPAQPAPAAGGSFFRRPAVLGALAGVLVLGVLAAFWFLRRPQPPPAPPPPPPSVALPKPPSQPPIDRLEEAKLQLAQGEDLNARRVLRSISFGEQGLLSPQGCRELSAIEETLALAALERLPADLAKGLRTGDLEVLRGAVEASAGGETDLAPEVRADFDRAREIIVAYDQVQAAAAGKDHVQVLERYAALAALLPKASDPEDLRGKAAQALEAQADTLVQNANYAAALTLLGPLQRTWPERAGLAERIERYTTYQTKEKEQEALLAALPGLERRKKPWDGLQMLIEVEPTPHLAPRFAEARTRLEKLFAQLDGQPPQVVLRDGYLLEYARGTVAELSFRATDDYQVKDIKVAARVQGGKFRNLSLETTRAGYSTVLIDPGFHNNGTVELYVVATDLSGHEAYLGSPDKPLQLKRKQGFERLIR